MLLEAVQGYRTALALLEMGVATLHSKDEIPAEPKNVHAWVQQDIVAHMADSKTELVSHLL